MPRTVPTGVDVERFLIASGMMALTPTVREQYLDLDLAADAAYEDFQKDTGIKPFLAEAANTTRYYDSQGGSYVQIHPYFSIAAVHVGSSFTTSSESKTAATDYVTFPQGDPPITAIEFAGYYGRGPQRIGVTGKRGWSDDLPADVFQALLGRAAGVHLQPSIAAAVNNGAVKWQEGDVSESYGGMGAYSAQAAVWGVQYAQTVQRYRQVVVHGAGRL